MTIWESKMKDKKVTLEQTEHSYRIRHKGHINDTQLGECREVRVKSFISTTVLNSVVVPAEVYHALRGRGLLLLNPENGEYLDVVIAPGDVEADEVKVTSHIRDVLNTKEDGRLVLIENKTRWFSRINIQRIENIKEDNIVVSARDMNESGVDTDKFAYFQIFNYYTGDSIIVKRSHIRVSSDLQEGTISLNKKQRYFLNLELPKHIPDAYWKEIVGQVPECNAEDLALLNEAYPTSDHFLKSGLEYAKEQRVLGIITGRCAPRVCMVPVVDSYDRKDKRGMKAVTDFYVGKSTVSLLCRRPYESDEGSDVVRMSSSNMNLLGVTEMDKVIIRYKDKSVSCRVLELDDEKAFSEANLPTTLNYAIGIPAHIRKKLGLYHITTAVKVDRDTSFIFKKSINEQIVPILLTLFSVNLFEDPSIWKKVLLSALLIPVVVYLNLSPKRNMRA